MCRAFLQVLPVALTSMFTKAWLSIAGGLARPFLFWHMLGMKLVAVCAPTQYSTTVVVVHSRSINNPVLVV